MFCMYQFCWEKKINWKQREKPFENYVIKLEKNGDYDVIVPVGGGKMSSYVVGFLNYKFKMNPLCVFCEPPLFTKLDKKINNFQKAGFDVLRISQNENCRRMERIILLSRDYTK